MNKCLVTTLKASTNNEALSKYNVLTVKIKAMDTENIYSQILIVGVSSAGSVSINSKNVGLYKSGISGELLPCPITLGANEGISSHFENKNGTIEISGKYNIEQLAFESTVILRARELYGLPDGCLRKLIFKTIEENEIDATRIVSKVDVSSVERLYIPTNVSVINKLTAATAGNFIKIQYIEAGFDVLFDGLTLEDIVNCIGVTTISNPLTGNISSLRKMTKLNSISFFDNKQCSGDIMGFITPWIQAGRTSGKLRTQYLKGQRNITLNGSPITFPEGSYGANGVCYINWTSNGTVTFTAS